MRAQGIFNLFAGVLVLMLILPGRQSSTDVDAPVLGVDEPLIVVMNDDALFKGLMNRFFEDRNEIGLSNKNKGKRIQAIKIGIHEHFNVPKDAAV